MSNYKVVIGTVPSLVLLVDENTHVVLSCGQAPDLVGEPVADVIRTAKLLHLHILFPDLYGDEAVNYIRSVVQST